MRRLWWIALWPGTAMASGDDWFAERPPGMTPLLDANDVAAACLVAEQCPAVLGTIEARVRTTCSLVASLDGGEVPEERGTPTDYANTTDLVAASALRCPGPVATRGAASGLPLGPAALTGLTDFLVGRARQELQTWAAERFVQTLCTDRPVGPVRPARLTPATCTELDQLRGLGAAEALTLVEGAVAKDAVALPRHLSEELLRANDLAVLTPALSSGEVDALVSSAVIGRAIEQIAEGRDPVRALTEWPRRRGSARPRWSCGSGSGLGCEDQVDEVALDATREPVAHALYDGMTLLAAFPVEDLRLRPSGTAFVDAPALPDGDGAWLVAAWSNRRERGANVDASLEVLQGLADDRARLEPAWRALGAAWRADSEQHTAASRVQLARAIQASWIALSEPGEEPSPWTEALASFAQAALEGGPGPSARPAESLVRSLLGSRGAADALSVVARTRQLTEALMVSSDAESARLALEALASPPGGFVHKRRGERPVYGAVGAYLGGGGGVEWLLDREATDAPFENGSPSVWPVVALGPELGLRVDRYGRRPWSVGLQAQLLDLGTLAQWRIDDPGAEPLPDLKVGHVLAPGVNLAIGLPNAPFAVLAGAAAVPSLRTIRDGALAEREVTSLRAGLSIAVDVPVLQ